MRLSNDDRALSELVQWMKTHPSKRNTDMPEQMRLYYDRLFLANTWLNAHGGSSKKVWPMLVAHYRAQGLSYSETTAKRDVADAMELFGTLTRATITWVTDFHLNNLMERMDSCKRAGKDKEYALLSAQLDKWLDRYERLVIAAEESVANPIPIMALQAPEELGVPVDPNIHIKIKAFLEAREKKKNKDDGIIDAEFTEE
jgi:hypothetical protein